MGSSIDDAVRAVVEGGLRLISDGLVEGTAGNVSVRHGDLVAISPSSIAYDRVRPQDVCVLDLDGTLVSRADGPRPSTETGMHLRIYRETDARAVVHHHGLASVAVSTVVDVLPALHYYIVRLGGPVRVAAYARYGTDQLARNVLLALQGRTAALMQNHGAITYGRSPEQAFDRALLLEWLCRLQVTAASMGTPRALSELDLAEVASAAYERSPS
ncbi:class II aldolase/adducin family protein [Pseudonocardia humida]|uniref:Class II aldolase/adducin family protein n=1 Tax=Pseudonocardia humida TaxID=2800819 RepID=A0ABT0ZY64_9PSEU|nr:class II aldolase/adducin family protein [Pseudonocardia humida]MCO1655689.1 class II aldolase/adducin family protein [Pseudonocardia humida]